MATELTNDILGGMAPTHPTVRDATLLGSSIAATAPFLMVGVVGPLGPGPA